MGTHFKYMLVAVLNTRPNTKNLPLVRGLASKLAGEVKDPIHSVLAELDSILAEQVVARSHTNARRGLVNKAMEELAA